MVKSQTMEQTRSEGRVEGRVEGQVLDRQEAILDSLTLRTKQAPPPDLAAKVRACRDMDLLRHWFSIAVQVDTLAEFQSQTGL